MSDALIEALSEAQQEVRRVNEANGWWEADRRPAEGLALIHSEVSEWLEALRDRETTTWFRHKDHCEHAPLNELHDTVPHRLGCTCHPKPEGAGTEAADVLVRLLDECERQEIDLGTEFIRKLAYNRTRGHLHGGKAL